MASNFVSRNEPQQCVRTATVRQNVAMTAQAILGLGHLDFTVTDGDRAMRWWEEVMGFTPAAWLSQL